MKTTLNLDDQVMIAFDFVKALEQAPTCRVLRPCTEYLNHLYATMRDANIKGNLVFDAQIIALCRENGISGVLTDDRDFERFDGVRVEYL